MKKITNNYRLCKSIKLRPLFVRHKRCSLIRHLQAYSLSYYSWFVCADAVTR